jgi:hypothetical protein
MINHHPQRALQLLLLWDQVRVTADNVRQHVAALQTYSTHRVHPVPVLGVLPPGLQLDRFDGLLVHYSLDVRHEGCVSPAMRRAIAGFTGIKAMFIQDEYRHVDRTIAAMQTMGIHVLFTCVRAEEIESVYPVLKLPGVIRHNVLTGYVDESLLGLSVPDPVTRPIDIGYRARKLPAWLGELAQEKWNIGQRVAEDAPRFGLTIDFAHREEERLYGKHWIDFMTRCKATLGVESGSSVFDFSGEVQRAVESDVDRDPGLTYEQLKNRHFGHLEGRIRLNQISPRCFEAAALRTLMVLYEGEYSGRLQPWRHYVPLRKDHSNFGEVVSVLRNPERIIEITKNAYEEVACAEHNSFRAMVREFDQVIAEASVRCNPALLPAYTDGQLERIRSRRSILGNWLHLRRWLFITAYFLFFRVLLGWMAEDRRDRIHRRLLAKLRAVRALRRSQGSREAAELSGEQR